MTQAIDYVLESLDRNRLDHLPCFLNTANDIYDINFRIGLIDGPQIYFRQEVVNKYYLTLIDENQKTHNLPILQDSEQFMKCQEIRNMIHGITAVEGYFETIKNDVDRRVAKLASIIKQAVSMLSEEK